MKKRITKSDLYRTVADYNNIYCKNTKNKLTVQGAYGGYKIGLTGKPDRRFKKRFSWLRGSLGSGVADVTYGYDTASRTLDKLNASARSGELARKIKGWERKSVFWNKK